MNAYNISGFDHIFFCDRNNDDLYTVLDLRILKREPATAKNYAMELN